MAAVDVRVANAERKASADEQRNAEAETVARLCASLIDRMQIRDRSCGGRRPLRAGDIALLAPTGTDMWRYEEALERHGIPVATQAGKGLYRRQEIQDLIAVTRVLADRRDTLALGALLRGPLVGLTEEELADIVWALPWSAAAPASIPRLDLRVSPEDICNPLACDILTKLQLLRRRVNEVTPHEMLAQAVDVLRVRPILLRRHPRQAERVLANVDLYLDLSRSYAIRGLRAFAEAMTISWMDESRAVEGRGWLEFSGCVRSNSPCAIISSRCRSTSFGDIKIQHVRKLHRSHRAQGSQLVVLVSGDDSSSLDSQYQHPALGVGESGKVLATAGASNPKVTVTRARAFPGVMPGPH